MSAHRGKTVTEAEFRKLWLDNRLSAGAIGSMLGISGSAVAQRARMRGLPARVRGSQPVRLDRDLMERMWRDNVGAQEMGRHFGRSAHAIQTWFRKRGIKRTCHGGNMLTVAQWQEMQIARRMAEVARETRAAMVDAEMVDRMAGRPRLAA